MKIHFIIKWLTFCAAFCASLAATSCVDDYYGKKSGEDSDQLLTLDILLHTPSSGPTAKGRAATDEEREAAETAETRIEDVSVLFFRSSTGSLYAVKSGTGIERPDGDKSRWTFRTSLAIETSIAGERFDCYVLANVGDISTSLPIHASYEEIRALLVKAVEGKLHTDHAVDNFSMWGKTNLQLDPSVQNQNLSVSLLRDVARVDIQVASMTPAIPFEMTEIHIFRPNNKIGLMPSLNALGTDDSGNLAVTKPSIPAGTIMQSMKWGYSRVLDNKIDYRIYIPEADVLMKEEGSDTATGTPGDINHTNRCAIVVGGHYAGSQANASYYRIDFKKTVTIDGVQKQVLTDVLRNHRYLVNIISVDGPGEVTSEDAYRSLSADISAEIIPWTDSNQDIVFDGANWASIGSKRVVLGSGAGVSALVALSSSVEPGKWTMRLGETGEFSANATVTGTHFSVTKPTVKEGGRLTIKTLNVLDDTTSRTEKLYIHIGRLEIIVTLIQNPDTGAPWEEGGDYESEL